VVLIKVGMAVVVAVAVTEQPACVLQHWADLEEVVTDLPTENPTVASLDKIRLLTVFQTLAAAAAVHQKMDSHQVALLRRPLANQEVAGPVLC
jgi:hypothetical protein